jgi:hypothetical protein
MASRSCRCRSEQSHSSGIIFIIIILNGVSLSPLATAATTGVLYKPQMIDEGDCGAIGGIKIGRGNRSTRRKPAPAPRYPPQIPEPGSNQGRRGEKPAINSSSGNTVDISVRCLVRTSSVMFYMWFYTTSPSVCPLLEQS